MNSKYLIFGVIILIFLSIFFYKDTSSYVKDEHYLEVAQKLHLKDKDYYIVGKDPYVHNSTIKQIKVNKDDYDTFDIGGVYLVKYSNSDEKGNILIRFKEK